MAKIGCPLEEIDTPALLLDLALLLDNVQTLKQILIQADQAQTSYGLIADLSPRQHHRQSDQYRRPQRNPRGPT